MSAVVGGEVSIAVASSGRRVTRQVRLDLLTDRLLFGMMLLALLASPFEVGYRPLGRIFFATFTNLEVVLLGLIAALMLRLVLSGPARRRFLSLPLRLPILALLLACAASTAFGEFKSLGVQFTYRLAVGMLVFASVGEALRGYRRLLAGLAVLVGGAVKYARLGLMEFSPWLDMEPWLKPFRPQPTTVGGMLRLSGTFEYANGAGVYFEMALPVLLGLTLLFSSRKLLDALFGPARISRVRQRVILLCLYGAVAVLTIALILTFSRASWLGLLLGMGIICGAGVLLSRKQESRWLWQSIRRPLAISAAVIAVAALYVCVTDPLLRLRLTGENDRAWYNYDLKQVGAVPGIAAGDVVTVPVLLTNPGPMEWNANRVPKVDLSYHWKAPGSAYYVVFDGLRTALPRDVGPEESVEVQAVVRAPSAPGEYVLEWDLVQENVTWFYEKSKTRVHSSRVSVGPAMPQEEPVPIGSLPQVNVQQIENSDTSTVNRLELWRVALAMFRSHPLTGVGPDGFRNLYGKYAGKTSWNTNIYTNNTYIEMFTNLGLFGGAIFLWLVIAALWRTLRNVMLKPPELRERLTITLATWLVCLGASASLVAFAMHGLVDYFLFSTPLYVAFWFILGVSVLWPRLVYRNNQDDPRAENAETVAIAK